MANEDPVIQWLLEGDPVIRWQTMRDLQDRSPSEFESERRAMLEAGWVSELLDRRLVDDAWPDGRWTGTIWTLLQLMDCGIPPDYSPVRESAERFIDSQLGSDRANDRKWLLTRVDLCHLGFWLRIGANFLPDDSRLPYLADLIINVQMADGGWNCRMRNYPETVHSSFHTTFNILEGLVVAAAERGIVPRSDFRAAEARAMEFMLAHRMYRSDRTGIVIDERFTNLTYPSHWRYTVLRGLDYMRDTPEMADDRLDDAIALLISRRKANGRWPVEKRIPGTTLVEMEPMGGDSRWNTLRALRVLRARERSRR